MRPSLRAPHCDVIGCEWQIILSSSRQRSRGTVGMTPLHVLGSVSSTLLSHRLRQSCTSQIQTHRNTHMPSSPGTQKVSHYGVGCDVGALGLLWGELCLGLQAGLWEQPVPCVVNTSNEKPARESRNRLPLLIGVISLCVEHESLYYRGQAMEPAAETCAVGPVNIELGR